MVLAKKSICVIGLGYIGLPLATFLAEAGYKVQGVDIDHKKIKQLKKGNSDLNEKDFLDHFRRAMKSSNLSFAIEPSEAEIFIVAVQTPLIEESKSADLFYVETAIKSILKILKPGDLVIIESTMPPFTCRNVVVPLIDNNPQAKVKSKDILLAHTPERAFPGNLIYELLHNDRIIGGMTVEAGELAEEIYSSFVKGNIFITDDVTAEMVKLAENTYRDINIAYANELQVICKELKMDVKEIIKLANNHPRVNILSPGIGVGGHCIPIDPWFIWQVAPEKARLIKVAREINDYVPQEVAQEISESANQISDPTIICIGKSYKPNVADTRESPALKVIEHLKRLNFKVKAYDPWVDSTEEFKLVDLVTGADILVILVEHDIVQEQLEHDFDKIKQVMRTPTILRF